MWQATIDRWLCGTVSHRRASIFDLPPCIREQIYLEAGIPYKEIIPFGRSREKETDSSAALATTSSLLLTSKGINSEVTRVIFSMNAFNVHLVSPDDSRLLQNLSSAAISSLTNMIIQYNDTSPNQQTLICSRSCSWRKGACERHPESDLRATRSPNFWGFQDALRHVLIHATPFKLHLGIVAGVSDTKTAERLLEPLSCTSTLGDCAIRLSKRFDLNLRSIARQSALEAMAKATNEIPFRLMDLPRELRLQILENTDLLIGEGEIEWLPERSYRPSSGSNACGQEYFCFSGNLSDPYLKQGIFCQRYSCSFSQQCHCWTPPVALFLSCQALREEALKVFFGGNRFVVIPKEGCTLPTRSTPDRLEVSVFLREIVPTQALSYLRFLEIVFPPFDGDFLAQDTPAFQDWIDLLNFLKIKLTPSRLTLRVHFADYDSTGYHRSLWRVNMTPAKCQDIFRAYYRTLEPLKILKRNLGCLFVHLASPWSWVTEEMLGMPFNRAYDQALMTAMERKIEQFAMDDDDYCSTARGKEAEKKSNWLISAQNANEYGTPMYRFDSDLDAWV